MAEMLVKEYAVGQDAVEWDALWLLTSQEHLRKMPVAFPGKDVKPIVWNTCNYRFFARRHFVKLMSSLVKDRESVRGRVDLGDVNRCLHELWPDDAS
jgi:hypothetical protein